MELFISELRCVTFHMESHVVSCHPTQVNTPRLNHSQTAAAAFAVLNFSLRSQFFQSYYGLMSKTELIELLKQDFPHMCQMPNQRCQSTEGSVTLNNASDYRTNGLSG